MRVPMLGAHMETGRDEVESFLEANPELEAELEALVTIDAGGPWEFDDIPLDSGAFGECVSRGIAVEHDDGGYRLANPDAVRAALDHDVDSAAESEQSSRIPDVNVTLDVPRETVLALLGALSLLVAFRVVFVYQGVFREVITLLGNDPYKRLYWVEQLQAFPAFDPGALGSIPEGVRLTGDTMMLVTLWWVSELFGGTPAAARVTLAIYPVVAAVVTGLFVYATTKLLTDDIRIALASVLMLAVTPINGYRMALGFGDHHAFDYVWIALTVLLVVWWERSADGMATGPIRNRLQSRRLWVAIAALGGTLAVQTMSWVGSPMVLVPFGLLVFVRGAVAFRQSRSPAVAALPYLGGISIAAVIVGTMHLAFGWLPVSRVIVPLAVFVLGAGAVGYFEACRSLSLSATVTVASSVVFSVVGTVGFALVGPGMDAVVERAVGLFRGKQIAESAGLFSAESGLVVQPILFFGFVLFLALPFIVLGAWHVFENNDPRWTAPVVYGVYFLFWAGVKVRFGGPLTIFTAIFGGIGFVKAAAWVDLARPVTSFTEKTPIARFERPEGGQLVSLFLLFLLVGSLGMVQLPIKQSQLVVSEDTYETAQWIDGYSDERNLEYPENGVFTGWSSTRIYNYFVNGHADSYWFEQQYFESFLGSTTPDAWYERLRDRYGFVVYSRPMNGSSGPTVERQLETGDSTPGFAQYRLVHTSGPKRVFQLVEGATIVGIDRTSDTVTAETSPTVSGKSHTYERNAAPNPYGTYAVTVPYPGTYSIAGDQVDVAASAVENGTRVVRHARDGLAHWPFDATDGTVAYDRVGGIQGDISNATVAENGVNGTALEFTRENDSQVRAAVESPPEFTVSMWLKPQALDTTDANDYRILARSGRGLVLNVEESGRLTFWLPGTDAKALGGGSVPVGNWTHVAATYDGSQRTLYVDGAAVATDTVDVGPPSWGGQLTFGGGGDPTHTFDGTIDEIRLYERALNDTELSAQAVQSRNDQ